MRALCVRGSSVRGANLKILALFVGLKAREEGGRAKDARSKITLRLHPRLNLASFQVSELPRKIQLDINTDNKANNTPGGVTEVPVRQVNGSITSECPGPTSCQRQLLVAYCVTHGRMVVIQDSESHCCAFYLCMRKLSRGSLCKRTKESNHTYSLGVPCYLDRNTIHFCMSGGF